MIEIRLTSDELAALDDGQHWYDPDDMVYLQGWLPDDLRANPPFSLEVNGEIVCQNWDHWGDMPEWLHERLTNDSEPVARKRH